MKNRAIYSGLMALTLLGGLMTPLTASAQRDNRDTTDNRDNRNRRDNNDNQDRRDNNDDRANRDRRDNGDNRDRRDNRDNRDNHTYRDNRDSYGARDNRGSYSGWSDNQRRDWLSRHRQETKNEWRNIAVGAGAVGVLGLLQHDKTLAFIGGAGALYSLNRYEQDRRSENRADRLRSQYFSRPYFYRDGVRYDRRVVNRDGSRYYRFERH